MSLNKKLNQNDILKFNTVVSIDYNSLSKKTDKFRLNVDVKKVITYQDLSNFLDDYDNYLSFLGKTQIELILKDNEWSKTLYPILAINKFKKLIKS